jgi:hypothetical protein
MATTITNRIDWTLIWAQRGFRYFFTAMFISLFGGGMNFAGVSWYIMAATHSTVKVSLQVIVVTLPGLFIPFIGGVLIDRFDRRYLGVALDMARGVTVLATAYIAWHGHLALWHLYLMTLVTGVASAMYWATVNALVQEVIPPSQFTAANAAVLIGVQSGLLIAGAFVGFTYDRAGIAGILAIDGLTYFVSAFCLYKVRRGYVSPREHQKYREYSEATEATAEALSTGENPEVAEAGISLAMYADLREGFQYLKQQPLVRALGITFHPDGWGRQRQCSRRGAHQRCSSRRRTRPGLSRIRMGGWSDCRRIDRHTIARGSAAGFVRRGICGAGAGTHGCSIRRVSSGRISIARLVRIFSRAWRGGGAVRADVHRSAAFYGPYAVGHGYRNHRGTTGNVRGPRMDLGKNGRHRRLHFAGVALRWGYAYGVSRAATAQGCGGILEVRRLALRRVFNGTVAEVTTMLLRPFCR